MRSEKDKSQRLRTRGGKRDEWTRRGGREEEREQEKEDANSLHEESHVSNRHMTWWHNAWWSRVDNGPHIRSATRRRQTWRAATRAAEQARDEDRAGEAHCLAEEVKGERW